MIWKFDDLKMTCSRSHILHWIILFPYLLFFLFFQFEDLKMGCRRYSPPVLTLAIFKSSNQSIFKLSLIVTFLALNTPDIRHGHTVHLAILYIVMELLVNTVELVALPG